MQKQFVRETGGAPHASKPAVLVDGAIAGKPEMIVALRRAVERTDLNAVERLLENAGELRGLMGRTFIGDAKEIAARFSEHAKDWKGTADALIRDDTDFKEEHYFRDMAMKSGRIAELLEENARK